LINPEEMAVSQVKWCCPAILSEVMYMPDHKTGYLLLFILIILAGCRATSTAGQTPAPQSSLTLTRTAPAPGEQTFTAVSPTAPTEREMYLGQSAPGTQPQVFLPGLVSTEGIELFFALHPNLQEAYFTRVAGGRSMIMVTYLKEGQWTEPVEVPFGSGFQDVGPFITQDGKRLFFWSNRPLTPTTPLMPNHQIWLVEREGQGWGTPRNISLPIDSLDGEWDVSVTTDGWLYYMANYPSLEGKGLYRTKEVDGVYQMPQKVEVLSNEEGRIELEPVIAPDGKFMIFYSVGREDNLTPDGRVGDLYISILQPNRKWSEPQNLGLPINSEAEEATPALSPDGRFLFYASNRDAATNFPDIYWVSMEALADLLPAK
jgi:hypothetical protein